VVGQTLTCHLCNQPVDITSAKTDERGKAVHTDCYAKALLGFEPAMPSNPLGSAAAE
jgi:hypothetical protein